jgi:uncharacterized phosphosugar-binding protein
VSAAEFLRRALEVLADVERTQTAAIQRAGAAVADALAADHRLWTFGTGHSHLLAEELYSRAGGLDGVRAVLEPSLMLHEGAMKSSALEKLPGLAGTLLSAQDRDRPDGGVAAGDVVLIASNSGRNAVPVEFAEGVKARGATVVAVTSLAHSTSVPSRAPSGKRLFEVADIVLDNRGVPGDALLDIEGSPEAVGATSTAAGALIVQAVVCEAVARLTARGLRPNVLRSFNAEPATTAGQ